MIGPEAVTERELCGPLIRWSRYSPAKTWPITQVEPFAVVIEHRGVYASHRWSVFASAALGWALCLEFGQWHACAACEERSRPSVLEWVPMCQGLVRSERIPCMVCGGSSILPPPIARTVLDAAAYGRGRANLTVAADKLQADGDPLGEILALSLLWMDGHREGTRDALRMLEAAIEQRAKTYVTGEMRRTSR